MQSGTYTITTANGRILCANKTSGILVQTSVDTNEHLLALAHVPNKSRSVFLLFDNPELSPFSVSDRKSLSPIITLRWRPMPNDMVALLNPTFDSYLIALPDMSQEGLGMLSLVAPGIEQGNCFRLEMASDQVMTPTIRHQIDLIEQVADTSVASILYLLETMSSTDRLIVASLLSETLIASEIELLVDYLFEDGARVRAFSTLFSDDVWADTGLPSIFDFVRARHSRDAMRPIRDKIDDGLITRPTRQTLIGPELDQLAVAGLPGEPLTFSHRCIITARSKIAPVKDVCIVATARNDGLYLLDWLAHHQAIGVDRMFLYTNDNEDGSDELLRVLAKAGEISLIESKLSIDGVSPVSKAYGHALSILPEILDYRWCAVIDSDEYIGIDRAQFESIGRFVEWQELSHVDVIFLNWVVFGSSGTMRWDDKPLPFRFQERYVDAHVKALFRPRFFHHAMPHFPYTRLMGHLTSRDAERNLHPSYAARSSAPRDSPAWIAHYFFRSFEEFVWKFARGRGDQPLLASLQQGAVPDVFMGSFIDQQKTLRLVPDSRVLAFSTEATKHVQRLRDIPGVREAIDAIQCHYRQKSEILELTLRTLRAQASPVQAAFYDLYLSQC